MFPITTPRCRRKADATRLLPPERAALSESGLATGGLAKDGRAALADDNGLGVGEDGGDGEAAGALHIHEEGSGCGHKGLELVLASLRGSAWVEEIDSQNLTKSIVSVVVHNHQRDVPIPSHPPRLASRIPPL
jgi:hypothetical protein